MSAFTIRSKKRRLKSKLAISHATPVSGVSSLALQLVFGLTLFVSASLLFMVQPMVAKMLLPLLGGAPAVWSTCMVFFQALLLGGYLYAHLSSTRLSLGKQFAVHAILVLVSAFWVPLGVTGYWNVFSGLHPAVAVLCVLALSVGMPFFTLSASAPLLQSWFAVSGDKTARNPYILYGASNLGSLLVLISYPTLMEPGFGLFQQSTIWGVGFGLLAACLGACTYVLRKSREEKFEAFELTEEEQGSDHEEQDEVEDKPPTVLQKVRWVALAFVPSSIMLGLTTYFTTDIATIPLLWTVPLALYLLSFIIVFAKWPQSVHKVLKVAAPILAMIVLYQSTGRIHQSVALTLFWHLLCFTVVTFLLHGEMANSRPAPKYLTHFFLWMSFGGMLGGIFNALVAPLVFTNAIEYSLILAFSAVMIPFVLKKHKGARKWVLRALDVIAPAAIFGLSWHLMVRWPATGYWGYDFLSSLFGKSAGIVTVVSYGFPLLCCGLLLFIRRPVQLGFSLAAFVLAHSMFGSSNQSVVHLERSFFGVLKVADDGYGQFRTLTHGTTLHGRQYRDPAMQMEPLTYYHKRGPVGDMFREQSGPRQKKNIAFIGLGTGTLAAYGKTGQNIDYYEIDPSIVEIASNYFHFLRNSPANISIKMGDARLKMEESENNKYGLILVDAFSSDAIPVHMLTHEAIQMYFNKLEKGGFVGIHTSNRYLALEPILGKLAEEQRLVARVRHDSSSSNAEKFASTWVVLARSQAHLGSIAKDSRWEKLDGYSWTPLWTDDYTSLYEILK